MENSFEIMERFLAQWESDVAGRATETIPAELRERLRSFAQGEANAEDRARLAAVLKDHPEWVRLLAGQIKEQRPESNDP